jgi:plastocyanin
MRIVRGIIMAVALVAAGAQAETVEKVTFTNKVVDGKKTWTPTEQAVKGGGKIELTLVNELDDPHGVSITGVTEDLVVKGKETKVVTVAAPKPGEYKVRCQMHPPHVGATLTVK